ncbi:MAG: hypothetical protein OQJ78_08485, partial [Ignavibacteriaceae bacterium]|nr:hypothetical protein [Ignavibacteriaceae bacterium]
EEAGPYVEERRETSVTPEEIEGELYDEEQDISEDAEEEDYEEEEEPEMGLRELVAQFMNDRADPFSEKKGMPMGGRSMEIEVKKEAPIMAIAKKAMKKKKR